MYYDIKSHYTTDDKYLAMVTENGIWIRDQLNGKINIINAKNMANEYLNDASITQFDNKNDFVKLITYPLSKSNLLKSCPEKLKAESPKSYKLYLFL